MQPDALRKKGNRTQVGLPAKERSRNAIASFMPGRAIERVRGKRVLLFDDVYTTGATVRSCARILRRAGAKVFVLTLARAASPFYGSPFV
jgi:predicted amidophosphoribosyltransferase